MAGSKNTPGGKGGPLGHVLSFLQLKLDKYVKQRARNTIVNNACEDQECEGFVREPGPGSCKYCQEHRLTHPTKDPRRAGSFHANCGCPMFPVFRRVLKKLKKVRGAPRRRTVAAGFKSLPKPDGIVEAVKNTNPLHGTDPAFNDNCQRCVMTYEMRRRGFNVRALGFYDQDDPLQYEDGPGSMSEVFRGTSFISCAGPDGLSARLAVERQMQKWGDGARAVVSFAYANRPGGHVIIAEQMNGRTVFVDPQTGSMHAEGYFRKLKGSTVHIMRIDNATPTALIRKCCVNA